MENPTGPTNDPVHTISDFVRLWLLNRQYLPASSSIEVAVRFAVTVDTQLIPGAFQILSSTVAAGPITLPEVDELLSSQEEFEIDERVAAGFSPELQYTVTRISELVRTYAERHNELDDDSLNHVVGELQRYGIFDLDSISDPERAFPVVWNLRLPVIVRYEGSLDAIDGLEVEGTYGDSLATGQVAISHLRQVLNNPIISHITLPRPLSPSTDESLSEIRVDEVHQANGNQTGPYTGDGTLIGIVDTGIDYYHPCFKSNGATRIRAIWDQYPTSNAWGTVPSALGYTGTGSNKGRVYRSADIDQAIDAMDRQGTKDPLTTNVPHIDRHAEGHGTAVASIAAGSDADYDGAAPDAELIVVASAFGRTQADYLPENDWFDVIGGVEFIVHVAQNSNTPVAINLSVGDDLGPHDGSSEPEEILNGIIENAGSRIALVVAAGNSADDGRHAKGTLTPNSTAVVPFDVPAVYEPDILEFWYRASAQVEVNICAPDEEYCTGWIPPWIPAQRALGSQSSLQKYNFEDAQGRPRAIVRVAHLEDPNSTGWNRVYLVLEPYPTGNASWDGEWGIHLKTGDGSAGTVHGYIAERRVDQSAKTSFSRAYQSPFFTISTPAAVKQAIAVGGSVTQKGRRNDVPKKGRFRDVAVYSGCGPSIDGRTKPDVVAPCHVINAAEAGTNTEPYREGGYRTGEGTSLAAPHVTGVVALMFQRHADLTPGRIRQILIDSASDPYTSSGGGLPTAPLTTKSAVPNHSWGNGRTDAREAIDQTPP